VCLSGRVAVVGSLNDPCDDELVSEIVIWSVSGGWVILFGVMGGNCLLRNDEKCVGHHRRIGYCGDLRAMGCIASKCACRGCEKDYVSSLSCPAGSLSQLRGQQSSPHDCALRT
jgi:hypothetical protein